MRRFLAVIGLLVAALAAACGNDGASSAPSGICRADADCETGTCDPFRGCVECWVSSQCANNERCLGGSCEKLRACGSNADCDGGHCDAGSKTCVSCSGPSDCEAGSSCSNGACRPASYCESVDGCRPGTVCDLSAKLCVECLADGDCASGRCIAKSCASACEGDGDCASGLVCDPLLGLCLDCIDSGDCAEAEHCAEGRCVLDTCVAGSSTCEASAQAVRICTTTGDHVVPQYCSLHATCVGQPGEAMCSDWICKPGFTQCRDGRYLETCSAGGLTIERSQDCYATGQACIVDRCQTLACDPASSRCDVATNQLHLCNANGTVDTATQCTTAQYCDAEARACKPKLCTPNLVACVGGQVSTCDELGSGYSSQKACKKSEICVGDACVPMVCEPSASYCGDDGNPYECNANGTSKLLLDVCNPPVNTGGGGDDDGAGGAGGESGLGPDDYGRHCEDPAGAHCVADACPRGRPYCSGNHLLTCSDDGSGPVNATGVDCGEDAVCVESAASKCLPKVCDALNLYCDAPSGDVYLCNATGTRGTLFNDRTSTQFCHIPTANCVSQVCTPNQPVCVDTTHVATCKADGSGPNGAGTACSAASTCAAGVCGP